MATRRLLRPLMDRVLVEKITPPTKSVGGVLLPETMTGKRVRTDDDDDGREGGFFSLLIGMRARVLSDDGCVEKGTRD